MYISFNFDNIFYSGTATPHEKENEYLVDLNDSNPEPIQFIVYKGSDGKWTSDDIISRELVLAAGSEIDLEDKGRTDEPMVPNNYHSGGDIK